MYSEVYTNIDNCITALQLQEILWQIVLYYTTLELTNFNVENAEKTHLGQSTRQNLIGARFL